MRYTRTKSEYPKQKKLSEPLNFDIKQGECLGLIGANGCGKTTLAKQLAGLYPIAKGSLVYAGSEGAVRTKRELMKRNYLCFQDPSSQIFSHSFESELVPKERLSDKDYLDKATDYLKAFDLWEYKNQHPQQLSRGQQQRLALIVAFMQQKDLLILDEPTAGLDHKRMKSVAKALLEYVKRAPILLISHDLELLFECCNRVLMLSGGKMAVSEVFGHEDEIRKFISTRVSL